MSEDQERDDPEARALSGNPDGPPQQADHTMENDRELLHQAHEPELEPEKDEEEAMSGKAAPDGAGGSDQPGTTLPGYG